MFSLTKRPCTNSRQTCKSCNVEPEDQGYILQMGKGSKLKLGMEYPFQTLKEAINRILKQTIRK